MEKLEFLSTSEEETKEIAKGFAKNVKPGDIILLIGELGSGKTTFSKGLCSYFSIPEDDVTSPSFTLLNIYYGSVKVYHLDFYRLGTLNDTDIRIFLDYIEDEEAIKLIEWNKLKLELPLRTFRVTIEPLDENTRKIVIIREGS